MRILDLFCKAGGSAMGLHLVFPDAEIVGVDIEDQPHYPFEWVKYDALEFLDSVLATCYRRFDFIWASPVCKRYTRMTNCRPGRAGKHPDQIAEVRKRLQKFDCPWVIENVPGSPLLDPIMLCGTMFGLELYRHRLFEASFPLVAPTHPPHVMKASRAGHWTPGTVMSVCGHYAPVSHARKIMGIDWMNREELSQAIPPAYSAYIAGQLRAKMLVSQCWHKETNDEGFCKACGKRAAITLNISNTNRGLDSPMDDNRTAQRPDNRRAVIPDCSTCGKPSPDGDPCLKCRPVDEYSRHLEDTCQE